MGQSCNRDKVIVETPKDRKSPFEQQYVETAQEEERNRAFAEWEHLASEGLDDTNDWMAKGV